MPTVVYSHITTRQYLLFNLKCRRVLWLRKEWRKMGFFMDGLDAEAYDRKYKDSQLVKRITGYFRPQLNSMLFVALLVVLGSLLDTAFPVLIARSIDTLLSVHAFQVALLLVGFILLSGALSWVFNLFRQWFTARAIGDVVLQLRRDAFGAVMSRDMSFFDEFSSGKIVGRVTSDTENFATVVTLTLNLLSQVLLFFLVAGILFARNWHLALLALSIMPAIILVAMGFRRLARRSTQRSQRSLARVNANVQVVFSGNAVHKNLRHEPTRRDYV